MSDYKNVCQQQRIIHAYICRSCLLWVNPAHLLKSFTERHSRGLYWQLNISTLLYSLSLCSKRPNNFFTRVYPRWFLFEWLLWIKQDIAIGLQVEALFLAMMSSRSDTVPQVEAQFELKACTHCGDWILPAGSKVPTSIGTLNNWQCDISSWGVRIHSQYCGMPISEDCNYQAKVIKIA